MRPARPEPNVTTVHGNARPAPIASEQPQRATAGRRRAEVVGDDEEARARRVRRGRTDAATRGTSRSAGAVVPISTARSVRRAVERDGRGDERSPTSCVAASTPRSTTCSKPLTGASAPASASRDVRDGRRRAARGRARRRSPRARRARCSTTSLAPSRERAPGRGRRSRRRRDVESSKHLVGRWDRPPLSSMVGSPEHRDGERLEPHAGMVDAGVDGRTTARPSAPARRAGRRRRPIRSWRSAASPACAATSSRGVLGHPRTDRRRGRRPRWRRRRRAALPGVPSRHLGQPARPVRRRAGNSTKPSSGEPSAFGIASDAVAAALLGGARSLEPRRHRAPAGQARGSAAWLRASAHASPTPVKQRSRPPLDEPARAARRRARRRPRPRHDAARGGSRARRP